MPDFDLDATAEAKSADKGALRRGVCGVCARSLYKEPSFPGVPSEWRHRSSGHPMSWSPTKHIASLTRVVAHAHRFLPVAGNQDRCGVSGCDAEMPPVNKAQRTAERTQKQQETAASRERGAQRGRETQKRNIAF